MVRAQVGEHRFKTHTGETVSVHEGRVSRDSTSEIYGVAMRVTKYRRMSIRAEVVQGVPAPSVQILSAINKNKETISHLKQFRNDSLKKFG